MSIKPITGVEFYSKSIADSLRLMQKQKLEVVEQFESDDMHKSADSLELQRKYLMDQSSTSSNKMQVKKPNLFILHHP